MKNVLHVENLQKYFKNKGSLTKAVDGISFSVEEGEYIGIMGASGSGKTTLLNCISTIDSPTSGKINICNEDITTMNEEQLADFRREKLGFIFQDFNLLDTLTAYDNIALSLAITGAEPDLIDKKLNEIANDLGIKEILNKFPYEISGGQKQRVACARAIITNPSLILADEPTGALDSRSAKMLLDNFRILNEKMKATILMVTHDAFTASHCKKILFIKDGKIFSEIVRGDKDRKEFFQEIIRVVSILGGDSQHVI